MVYESRGLLYCNQLLFKITCVWILVTSLVYSSFFFIYLEPPLHLCSLLQDACATDTVDEPSVPPVPKNGGGDSETSEFVGTDNCSPPPKTPSSPTKSPKRHSPLSSTPQANDGIPTDMSDTTESEPDSKLTCKSLIFVSVSADMVDPYGSLHCITLLLPTVSPDYKWRLVL